MKLGIHLYVAIVILGYVSVIEEFGVERVFKELKESANLNNASTHPVFFVVTRIIAPF